MPKQEELFDLVRTLKVRVGFIRDAPQVYCSTIFHEEQAAVHVIVNLLWPVGTEPRVIDEWLTRFQERYTCEKELDTVFQAIVLKGAHKGLTYWIKAAL